MEQLKCDFMDFFALELEKYMEKIFENLNSNSNSDSERLTLLQLNSILFRNNITYKMLSYWNYDQQLEEGNEEDNNPESVASSGFIVTNLNINKVINDISKENLELKQQIIKLNEELKKTYAIIEALHLTTIDLPLK